MPFDDFVGRYEDRTPRSVSIDCGYCSRAIEANRIGPAVEISREERGSQGQRVRVAAAYVCPRDECHRLNLVSLEIHLATDNVLRMGEVIARLPRGQPKDMDGLPTLIAADRREAWSCFFGGDRRASVIMGRAAIQRAARSLEAGGGSLAAEIDDLQAKGVITTELKAWAHEVRLSGNDAAHPDTLGAIDAKEAEESLAFMDAFLEAAIALPARRAARETSRNAAKPGETSDAGS